MMEDMMLNYRLERSVERRVFKVNVGAIDEEDVPAYMDEIANNFKRTPLIDPMTGQMDLRKGITSQLDDFFIPIRDSSDPTAIETLAAGQNMTAIDDIKFVQNKLCTALRVPKSFLNFEEAQGDGKNLSMLDVRFSRTLNRVQQMMLMELNKVCIIHLFLLGFEDELTSFSLSMNNASSQSEMMELDNLSKKIEMAKSAVADPGGGLPLMSVTRACKEILGMSDKEIRDNLEELRLEKAWASELEGTANIIKKTGFFDKVDNLYGDIDAIMGGGAAAGSQQDNGEEGMPGGGGMPMGDLGGGPGGEGDMGGEGGEMDMGDAAAMEGAEGGPEAGGEGGPEAGGGEPAPLTESFMERLRQKTVNERQRVEKDIMEKTLHYQQLLSERMDKDRMEEQNKLNVPIYKKSFLVNEELNSIATELQKKLDKKTDLND